MVCSSTAGEERKETRKPLSDIKSSQENARNREIVKASFTADTFVPENKLKPLHSSANAQNGLKGNRSKDQNVWKLPTTQFSHALLTLHLPSRCTSSRS
eukprot:2258110-Rhodomonas_salina.1